MRRHARRVIACAGSTSIAPVPEARVQVDVITSKRVMKTESELPTGEAYGDFVRTILAP